MPGSKIGYHRTEKPPVWHRIPLVLSLWCLNCRHQTMKFQHCSDKWSSLPMCWVEGPWVQDPPIVTPSTLSYLVEGKRSVVSHCSDCLEHRGNWGGCGKGNWWNGTLLLQTFIQSPCLFFPDGPSPLLLSPSSLCSTASRPIWPPGNKTSYHLPTTDSQIFPSIHSFAWVTDPYN